MKAENAIKRIENVNGLNRNTKAYRLIMEAIDAKRNFIRPCWVQGSGRYIKNADYTSSVCDLLKRAGIKYKLENDAPRGCLHGNIITLTHIIY